MPNISDIDIITVNLGNSCFGTIVFGGGSSLKFLPLENSSEYDSLDEFDVTLTLKGDPMTLVNSGKDLKMFQQALWDKDIIYASEVSFNDKINVYFVNVRTLEVEKMTYVYDRISYLFLTTKRTGYIRMANGYQFLFELNDENNVNLLTEEGVWSDLEYFSLGEYFASLKLGKFGNIERFSSENIQLRVLEHAQEANYYILHNTNAILRAPRKDDDYRFFSLFYFDSGTHEIALHEIFPNLPCFKATQAFLLEFSITERRLSILFFPYGWKKVQGRLLTVVGDTYSFMTTEIEPVCFRTTPFSHEFSVIHPLSYYHAFQIKMNTLNIIGVLASRNILYPRVNDLTNMTLVFNKSVCYVSPCGLLFLDFAANEVMYVRKHPNKNSTDCLITCSNIIQPVIRIDDRWYCVDTRKGINSAFSTCVSIRKGKVITGCRESILFVSDGHHLLHVPSQQVEDIVRFDKYARELYVSDNKIIFFVRGFSLVTVSRNELNNWEREDVQIDCESIYGNLIVNRFNTNFFIVENKGFLYNAETGKSVTLNVRRDNSTMFLDGNTVILYDGVYRYTSNLEVTKLFGLSGKKAKIDLDSMVYRRYLYDNECNSMVIHNVEFVNEEWKLTTEVFCLEQFFYNAKFVSSLHNPFDENDEYSRTIFVN
ncbi:hypothetical protein PCE1_001112 [Barthelona sp. PCE]